MRILITSSSNKDTIAGYYTQYLAINPEIELVPVYTFDVEEGPGHNNPSQRIIRTIFPGHTTRQVSTLLEAAIEAHQPDVVIIIKGMHIHPEMLDRIKRRGIFLVNYNPDHPLWFETRASGNRNIVKSLPYYHLVITYSPVIEDALKATGLGFKTAIIPFGYQPGDYTQNSLGEIRMVKRVCFAGTGDRDRAMLISRLLRHDIPVDVYGHGYKRWLRMEENNLNLYPGVFGNTYFEKLQAYAVSLNLYRRQNKGSHNMRSFEIPSVGGIQVVEYSQQMAQFFNDQREVFMYRDDQELVRVIHNLLDLPEQEIRSLKIKAREKTLQASCSYVNRAKEMVKIIKAGI